MQPPFCHIKCQKVFSPCIAWVSDLGESNRVEKVFFLIPVFSFREAGHPSAEGSSIICWKELRGHHSDPGSLCHPSELARSRSETQGVWSVPPYHPSHRLVYDSIINVLLEHTILPFFLILGYFWMQAKRGGGNPLRSQTPPRNSV